MYEIKSMSTGGDLIYSIYHALLVDTPYTYKRYNSPWENAVDVRVFGFQLVENDNILIL